MTDFQLTLVHEPWGKLPKGHHAIQVTSGTLTLDDQTVEEGGATYVNNTQNETLPKTNATIRRFSLAATANSKAGDGTVMSSMFTLDEPSALMRLDQVTFPPGASAYRHTHPGPGIRYLLRGSLELVGDTHTQTMNAGDAWFEDADSPVKAIADKTQETAFIRCMILPIAFKGRATINILDANDKLLPALQMNHRYLDQLINLA